MTLFSKLAADHLIYSQLVMNNHWQMRICTSREVSWHRVTFAFLLLLWSAPHCAIAQAASSENNALERAVASGSAALQRGDYANAEQAFQKALALDPTSVPILNNLAISVARQQRAQEAIALYHKALKIKPNDSITERNLGVAYFRAREYKLALPLLEGFARESSSFQALDLTGLDLFALDRYQEAAQYLEKALRVQQNDLLALDMLGKAYMRTKNYSGVTKVFSRLMTINPGSAEAHTMMAMAYDKLYHEDEAIKEFEAALAADPHYPGIHTGLGVIYWRNRNPDAAEREFREELSRYPTDPIANCTLGRILLERNKPGEAAPYLEAALAVNPSYRNALLALGQTSIALEEPGAAIQPLQRAITLNPKDAEAHYILGTALIKNEEFAEGAKQRMLCAQLRAEQRSHSEKHAETAR